MEGDAVEAVSTLADFDPETLQFKLAEPRELKAGAALEIFSPGTANWRLEGNTITACLRPMDLDSYGGPTCVVRGNLISRGAAEGVTEALAVRGQFALTGNTICGFEEEGSVALGLHPDRAGRDVHPVILRNIIERCAGGVGEERPGLWSAARTADNLFLRCGAAPE